MATAKTTTGKTTTTKTLTTGKTAKTTEKKTIAKKTTTAKTSTEETTTKKVTAKKATAAKKTSTGTSIKVTAAEKKFLELYRAADSDTRKAAAALLKGEKSQLGGVLDAILENKTIMNTVTSLFK